MTLSVARSGDLNRVLTRKVGRAIRDYRMIEQGDRVLVAVSGGKDSFTLLDLLEKLRRRAPVRFELVACNVDQGYQGFRSDVIEEHLRAGGYSYRIETTEIAGTIRRKMDPEDTLCSLCARLRRGVLYRLADETGCNKIALGHHADDIIETLLMLQFFNGQTKTMPPVLRAENGRHTVVRPLVYVWEREIVAYVREKRFPVVCCCCSACGDSTLQRQQIKAFLGRLEEGHPGVKASLLKATRNVHLAHLMDPRFLPVAGDGDRAGPPGPPHDQRDPGGPFRNPPSSPSALDR
jgi:tRNA 2-thiocytidine biosynthesis protein TtcA